MQEHLELGSSSVEGIALQPPILPLVVDVMQGKKLQVKDNPEAPLGQHLGELAEAQVYYTIAALTDWFGRKPKRVVVGAAGRHLFRVCRQSGGCQVHDELPGNSRCALLSKHSLQTMIAQYVLRTNHVCFLCRKIRTGSLDRTQPPLYNV